MAAMGASRAGEVAVGGRERASVTTLEMPGVWMGVMENSERKAS
jgi:hypothetical protein